MAHATKKLLADSKSKRYISTPCPAVFGYVKRNHAKLIKNLAPIVSHMIATGRAIRKIYGEKLKIIFGGPCIAKKKEVYSDEISNEIDEALTFSELHYLI